MSEAYCHTVVKEIEQRLTATPSHTPLETVFYGGGTPGYLDPVELNLIHEKLRQTPGIAANAEVTLETTPMTLSEEKVQQWLTIGINRVSMGIESLQDSELKSIGRDHDSATAIAGVQRARRAGIKNLALDLIFGLPGQTVASWQDTLDKLLALEPEHLSAYGLNITGSLKLHFPPNSSAYPDDDTFAAMYDILIDTCKEAGLEQYEISNFCRPGYQSRHNLCYWTNNEYLAFGVGAHRYVDGVRSANLRSFNRYMRDCSVDESSEPIDQERKVADAIMLGLRLCCGLNLSQFKQTYQVDLMSRIADKLPLLVDNNLAELNNGVLKLTRKGILISNTILAELI